MKTIVGWILALVCTLLVGGCGGGNGGNATSRATPVFSGNALTINVSSLLAAVTSQSYSQTLSASGGIAPYTWSVASGTLPAGLTLNAMGTLSGIPTTAGSCIITFRVVDSGTPQNEARQALTMTVTGNGGALSITTGSLPAATVGSPYNQTLTASGGQAPYSWSVAQGPLPGGLNMSSAGVISGTPTSAGSFPVTFRVTDSSTPQGSAQMLLTITVTSGGGPLTIVTTTLPSGKVGVPYSQTMVASGGSPPYHWSLMSGALPPGLSLSDAGVLDGTPTAAGTYTALFMVTDANPADGMVHQSLSVIVNP